MSTPAVSPSGFDWHLLLGVIESAGNTATELLIPGGAAFEPLLAELEGAVNPLLLSIGTKQTTTSEAMIAFGTTIGILNILKNKPGVPANLLAKIDEYLAASQAGLAAYLLASKGFDASEFAPVTPIT